MRRVAAVLVLRGDLVMIIEREHVVVLVLAGKDVVGVAVVALREFLKKAESFVKTVIVAGIEIEVQSLREHEKTFSSFARGNRAIHHADNDENKNSADK